MSAATDAKAIGLPGDEPTGPKSLVHMTEERRAEIEQRLAAHEGAMDELRRDLERVQSERDRYKQQRQHLQTALAHANRDLIALRRLRTALIHKDPESAKEAMVAMAARATLDRDRAHDRALVANRNNEQLRSALKEATDALRDALEKCSAPDCDSCRGTGQHPPEEDCEDCGGVGLEWYPAVEVAS